MLSYNGQGARWEGSLDNMTFLWMTDETFQRYVDAYLEGHFITHPTPEQRIAAIAHCRQESYWQGCYDCEVHVRRAPRPQAERFLGKPYP